MRQRSKRLIEHIFSLKVLRITRNLSDETTSYSFEQRKWSKIFVICLRMHFQVRIIHFSVQFMRLYLSYGLCIFLSLLDFDIDRKLDVETDTPQTQMDMDEDMEDMNCMNKLWTTSEQGSGELFTNADEPEESEVSSDNSESESNNSFTINSTLSLSDEIGNDQVMNMMMTEAQQLNCTASDRTAEEENVKSDLAAGVSTCELLTAFTIMEDGKDLTEEEHRDTFNVECLPQTSPPMSNESQSSGETSSESDEELPEKSSPCQSFGNKDEPVLVMSPNHTDKDDMKEFTEDDQEQIEESLADYPSDLSHSETEEPTENAQAQTFTLMDVSSGDDHLTHRIEDGEKMILQNKDSPTLDYNFETKGLEDDLILADLDLSLQRGSFDEENAQKSFTNDRNIEEDTQNREESEDLNGNDQTDYISDSSSEDHSTSQEETNLFSSAKKEEEKNHISHHIYSAEDMTRMDDDIDYICVDTGDEDAYSPEEQDVGHLLLRDVVERGFTNKTWSSFYEEPNAEPTELHHSTESVQSHHDKVSSESSDSVEDTKSVITELLSSSILLMDEDNLCLDEYDWDLSDSFKINSGEGKNPDYTECLDDLDFEEHNGSNNRDWEMEKPRIEAFYRFYGDQAEAEDDVGKCFTEPFITL